MSTRRRYSHSAGSWRISTTHQHEIRNKPEDKRAAP